jgi:hypothetical protein
MNKLIFVSIFSVIAVAGVFGISMAGHYHHGYSQGYHGCTTGMGKMSDLDGDGNGTITFDEFSAPQNDRLMSAFKMLDTNNDNMIDKDEWNEFLKVHGIEPPVEG